MYQLYGNPGSGSCAVELALAELKLPYEFHEIELKTNEQRHADYARINPQQKVPALVCEDGNVITESVAIILWLLDKHGNHHLLPAQGSNERSQALRWLIFVTAELYPIIEIIDYPQRFTTPESDADAVLETAINIWRTRWLVMEDHIAGDFLLGSECCITDFYISVVSRWAGQGKWRRDNIPKIEKITELVSRRELCKEVWARNFPGK